MTGQREQPRVQQQQTQPQKSHLTFRGRVFFNMPLMRPMVALNSSGATRESKPQGNSTLKRLLRPKLQNKRRIIYYACQIKNIIIKYSKFHTSHRIKIAHTLHSVTAAEFIVIFIPTTFKREGYYNFVLKMTMKAQSSRYCLVFLKTHLDLRD